MQAIQCPIDGCSYSTPDNLEPVIVAALLNAHTTSHSNANFGGASKQPMEKVRRPIITPAGTTEDWSYFLSRWKEYKLATRLTGMDIVMQLLECCEEPLRKDLTRTTNSDLTARSEEQLLSAIRLLAVREEKVMVSRVLLHQMRQNNGEAIRAFAARVKGQAHVCEYFTKCHDCEKTISYADTVVRDMLTLGIADQDIQLELLGNVDQDMSLENVIKYIEVKEAGKRSTSLLQQYSETAAASTYSRNKKRQAIKCIPETSNKRQEAKCIFCGKCGHGLSAKLEQRRKHCPAYGNECKICNKLNHCENVCRSSDTPMECNKAVTNDINANDTIFTSLCMIQSKNNHNKLGHHVYDPSSDAWLNHAFQPQPTIQLQARLHPDDYSSLGYQLPSYNQSVTVTALADTGCQCCLAGTNLLQHLNLRNDDLIPTKMAMNAANNKAINILGAVVVRLKSLNNLQNTTETRQMIYITTDTDRMFLSREACAALGIIQKDFPHITLTDSKPITGSSSLAQQAKHSACDRQPRCPPPSSSTKPSCVPPPENS